MSGRTDVLGSRGAFGFGGADPEGGAFVFVYYLLYLGSVVLLALIALATQMIPARRGAVTPAG